jgi:L,D-transpeptidase ErfK/SrfK
MILSPFPLKLKPTGKKRLIIRLHEHAFAAYDTKGELVHWGPISGGKSWCKDTDEDCSTAVGQFKIYRRQGASCTSSKYPIETKGGAPMPYCMHYHKGWAIHGSTLPGFHNSHGCVRLFHADAKWLNEYFASIGTRVIVEHGGTATVPMLGERRTKRVEG